MSNKGNARKGYVIDTSYLIELYRIPKNSDPVRIQKVKSKFDTAIETGGAGFYVPIPCIFELAKFISYENNGNTRLTLANRLLTDVQGKFWIILPSVGPKFLADLCKVFADKKEGYALKKISLTDSFIIEEAKRIKDERKIRVHIWTMDRAMKANEPDNEPDAYLGEK